MCTMYSKEEKKKILVRSGYLAKPEKRATPHTSMYHGPCMQHAAAQTPKLASEYNMHARPIRKKEKEKRKGNGIRE